MLAVSNYHIDSTLHEGIETIVYRVQTPTDQKPTILKILKAEYPTLEAITRLKHEYQIRKNLNHPGIVKVISLETFNNRLGVLLEDFGGESLSKLLQTEKLSITTCLNIAIQLAKALEYLHQNQIIHKDIKPSNIIINPQTGIVKLTDFGIASCLNKETPQFSNPNIVEGTLAYMSPEQTGRMNRTLDYRTDFYSFGVTLYEMLAGQLPFQSHDPLELVYSHIATQPIPPQQLNPDIPQSLSEIVMKLMAKNAEDRYQSAAGILGDLEICLNPSQTKGEITDFIPGRLDILSQLLIPQKLYGREKQVNLLLSAFNRAAEGASELMLVSGYSGIGKSAVVNEINKPITRQRGYFISGKFDQFKRNIPYASLTQAFGYLMRQLLTESAEKLQQWHGKISTALGVNGQVIIDVIPELELIIGKQPELPQLGPTESQNRFNRVFAEFLRVFTQKEHPLVIFLDDLQWADSATLNLMQLLMSDLDSNYLLLIGAYRDNEVSSTHPLIQTVEEIKKAGTVVNNIVLQPLDLDNVTQLIADTLQETRFLQETGFLSQRVIELAELLCNKTGGNPFFLMQLLQALYQEKLLTFDFNSASWQWSLEEIQAIGITDKNVVELVASRIEKLPKSTQEVLKLAACVGDRFTLDVLSIVNEKSPSVTASELYSALQAGLILPLSEAYKIPLVFDESENSHLAPREALPPGSRSQVQPGNDNTEALPQGARSEENTVEIIEYKIPKVGYKFLHDRVQQAAYSLIPNEQKKTTHLKIGRLLLENTPKENLEENIFDIVNQLNVGIDTISQQEEKYKLAQLNWIAGKRSKAASAYKPAANYLNTGLELLASDSWENQYDLTLNLHLATAEAEYLTTNFERSHALLDVILTQAKNLLDRVKAYRVKVEVYIAQVQMQNALDTGLSVIEMLGVKLENEPPQVEQIEELINLPEMTDPGKIAALWILLRISNAAYVANPGLLASILLTMTNLCIKYGNSPEAAKVYVYYGSVLCGSLNEIDAGYRYGQLSLKLLDKFHAKELQAFILNGFNGYARFWKEQVRETLNPLRVAYACGLESGEIVYGGYAILNYCKHSFFVGESLEILEQKHRHYIDEFKKQRLYYHVVYGQIGRQLILNLLGQVQEPVLLMGEAFNEQEMIPVLTEQKNGTTLFYVYLAKAMLHYLFEQPELAIANSQLAESYLQSVSGLLISAQCNFYQSLALLAHYPHAEASQQSLYLEKLASNQEKMQQWAYHAPMNFQHKYDLVEAEKARVLGNKLAAIDDYDLAIKGAAANNYLNEEALAYELAGKFYQSLDKEIIAQAYLTKAYYAYMRWGAIAKVKALESNYPFLAAQSCSVESQKLDVKTTTAATTTNSRFGDFLDLSTFVKSSQAIAREIILENLLSQLIKILLENAAAQKGFLLLLKDDQLYIEASATATDDVVKVLQSIPVATCDDLPRSVINYVKRTQENLVLNNAMVTEPFNADVYIQECQPKSILCLPILYQSKLQGILYLENNLAVGAFTKSRIEVLQLLCSQAAISLENARLYTQLAEYSHTLEEKVAARTAELKAAQKQIIAQEKLASLGTLTAGVAHELKNPLNFVNNFAELSVELAEELLAEIENQAEPLDANTLNYTKETLSDIKENVAIIQQHGQRADRIIHNMMQHARTDSNTRQPTNLNALLDQAVQLAYHSRRSQNNNFNVTINKDYDDSIGQVNVVSADLNRAFINIIDNACYAVEAKQKHFEAQMGNSGEVFTPTLWVKTQNKGEIVEIRIRDNGIGIAPDLIDKIFHPFFTTKPAGEGTGLGLSLTYDIIVGHPGGTLNVESELGEYTEFIISLSA
ncbi:AAA family ATPase [Microseira sp. BLCC-F43]|jgi:predicted ATPase/signal transduction histidine kinase/tRNA A-37 threonylcarbamoyl transferase component Bud32|uniref:trifunctional serine/threonine-protein kinase/ATP-binding protein/sensor histidine kinase n=1 Tax=Microseira sp. BLCC-F43 TaxID=3153602 RepID=UPI0035B985D0